MPMQMFLFCLQSAAVNGCCYTDMVNKQQKMSLLHMGADGCKFCCFPRHVCISALPALTSGIDRMRAQHTVSSKDYFMGLLASKHLRKIDVSKGCSYVQ